MRTACLMALTAALTVSGTSARAATLTIDSPNNKDTSIVAYGENGFLFTFSGGSPNASNLGYRGKTNYCSPTCADDGTYWLMTLTHYGWADTVHLRALDGSPFTLESFWGAETFAGNAYGSWASGIHVTGVRADSTTVTHTFALDQVDDGAGGGMDFQIFTLPGMGPLVEVLFTGVPGLSGGKDFTIDNVRVNETTAVPEPASATLLGSGVLVALIMSRSRRRRCECQPA